MRDASRTGAQVSLRQRQCAPGRHARAEARALQRLSPVDATIETALGTCLAGRAGGVLLAVSGGPDSTALLAATAALNLDRPIHVATVDHGLRPGAADEAGEVAALCGRFDLPHRTLAWIGPKPSRGIQAAARAARYALLAAHARDIGAGFLLTAHTRDDQAETVLLRLMAGSGPAGLAGMRAERFLPGGVHHLRPFLTIPKADLVAYCEGRGLAFVQDPANRDDRFARTRLRALMPKLAAEGLTSERLCRLAVRCGREAEALDAAADIAFARASRPSADAGVHLDGTDLRLLHDAVALRVVRLGLERAGPDGPERLERLERLVLGSVLPAIRGGVPLRRTLREVLIEVTERGDLLLAPAPPRRGREPAPAHRPGDG